MRNAANIRHGFAAIKSIWNAYYHFFITSKDFDVVQEHACHLLSYADTLEAWQTSPYGANFLISSDHTLDNLRKFWQHYTEKTDMRVTEKVGASFRQEMKNVFNARVESNGVYTGGARSAGYHAAESFGLVHAAFRAYWNTGVIAGNDTDLKTLKKDKGGFANPLLAWSSSPEAGFAVHYGTDCIAGFHIASLFDRAVSHTKQLQTIGDLCKTQFFEWCATFAKVWSNVTIAVHSGDAINFCHELQRHVSSDRALSGLTHVYVQPWSATPLKLYPNLVTHLSTPYDVVDTSNLLDHIGLLNILPAVTPLMNDLTCSVLFTESLLRGANEPFMVLSELLGVDIPKMSPLLGLAPMGCLSETTSESFGAEALLMSITESRCRLRIPWTHPASGDSSVNVTRKPAVESKELASFIVRWYVQMFSKHEDITRGMATMMSAMKEGGSQLLTYYSRITLVALINLLMSKVSTDWTECLGLIIEGIVADRTLMLNSDSFQDLFVQLHVSGLSSQVQFKTDPRELDAGFGRPRKSLGEPGLLGRLHLPQLVHLVLVIPRSKLRLFTKDTPNQTGTPGLHVSIYNNMLFENSFHAIDAFFGQLGVDRSTDTATVKEDILAWRGTADLIVTCLVPTFPFLVGARRETRVALAVNRTLATARWARELGLQMRVFDAGLDDGRLYLLRSPPRTIGYDEPTKTVSRGKVSPPGDVPAITIRDLNDRAQASLTGVIRYAEEEAQDLTKGATVRIVQESPCSIAVFTGSLKKILAFPYPIDGSSSKTRIARKQHWIEVTVTQAKDSSQCYQLQPFPLVSFGLSPCPWNLTHINLDTQPRIPAASTFPGLPGALGMTLSNTEQEQSPGESLKGHARYLLNLKESLCHIFKIYLGDPATGSRDGLVCFGLEVDKAIDTIILINCARHDLHGSSVVLDALIIPLDESRGRRLKNAVKVLVQRLNMNVLSISKEENVLWKHLMPAFVERSRFAWTHNENCEYQSAEAKIPLSVLAEHVPICSCGLGKDVSLPSHLKPFEEAATRAAISPLSSVIYNVPMVPDELKTLLASQDDFFNSSTGPCPDASAATQRTIQNCHNCGATRSDLKSCQRCGKARYCNRECQKAAWKSHKKECKAT